MNRATLDDLKARQVAFLEARLVSDAAARQWREELPRVWAALLETPLRELADASALGRALDALLSRESVRAALRPAAAAALRAIVDAARADRTRASALVPGPTRTKLDRLLERPDIVPERLVREVMHSDAMNEVLRDILFEALKEFSEKVNPFVADWGLPALLKRLPPFGLGAFARSVDGARAEFERRMDPEIRKFLHTFTRRSMRETAERLIARADAPEFVGLRKHVASWALAMEVRTLAGHLDDEGAALAQEIGLDVTAAVLTDAAYAERRRRAVADLLREHGARPIGGLLASLGVAAAPDFDAVAAATWPLVRALCASAPVRAWLAAMVAEFFDGLPDDAG